jgi:hypothetical protein
LVDTDFFCWCLASVINFTRVKFSFVGIGQLLRSKLAGGEAEETYWHKMPKSRRVVALCQRNLTVDFESTIFT